MTLKRLSLVMIMMMALGAGLGCSKKQTVSEMSPLHEGSSSSGGGGSSEFSVTSLDSATQAITDGVIYFEFDKFNIEDEYREMLRQKAELMKAYPTVRVLIEGNCDERGTQEYNMALGERRARAAYEYLVMLGVNPNQLEIISFGKERPAVQGSGPEAWSKNRRDDFRVVAR